MEQLDLFPETLETKSIAGICRAAPDGYNILVDPPPPPSYEVVKTSVQQQWDVTFGSPNGA